MNFLLILINLLSNYFALKSKEHYRVKDLPLSPNTPNHWNLGYAGYIPIRKGAGELFFWYFESQSSFNTSTPIVIWLQGGPGASSMIGLFNLHGPLQITDNFLIQARNYSWNKNYHVLYIDQPVGSGYSYVNTSSHDNNFQSSQYPSNCYNNDGYPIDQCGIGNDLIDFLIQFAKLFPDTHQRPMYLTGESYAGKYIPTLATDILDHNDRHGQGDMFNLKGLAIGDGLTDPESQIDSYAPLALSLGLATPNQALHIQKLANQAKKHSQQLQWFNATRKRNDLFSYFRTITNGADFYDVRNGIQPHEWNHMEEYLNRPEVKHAVHVPSHHRFYRDPKVLISMQPDIMKSTTYLFPKFQDRLSILLFQGQFDYRDGPLSQYSWMYQVFPCLLKAPRKVSYLPNFGPKLSLKPWFVDNQTAGYLTICPNHGITHAIVLQAGHMVSLTQPARGRDLLDRLIMGDHTGH